MYNLFSRNTQILAPWIRTIFITAAMLILWILQARDPAFLPAVNYVYLILIFFSGICFGIFGGIVSAICAGAILANLTGLPLEHLIHPHTEDSRAFLVVLAAFIMGGAVAGYHAEIEKRIRRKLELLAKYDELTGCYNFRAIMEAVQQELSRAKRYRKNISIALLDIDFFKKINDCHGHLLGNEILRLFGETLRNSIRNCDAAGRYGGEEFLLVLPETPPEQALSCLVRIQNKLAETVVTSPERQQPIPVHLHFSAGIASFPGNGDEVNSLLSLADHALYKAKKSGRNRIVLERRRWIRFKPLAAIRVILIDFHARQMLEAVELVDISQEGMQLTLPQHPPYENLLCRIFFEADQPAIELESRIVRRAAASDGLAMIGVEFSQTTPAFRQKIQELQQCAAPPAER